MSKRTPRLVPLAAARLRAETTLRITLLAKTEKLAKELREHLELSVGDDDLLMALLQVVECCPFKPVLADKAPE